MARHARKFLAINPASTRPYVGKPHREPTDIPDDPETVALIASRTDIRDEPEAVSDAIVDAYKDLARTYDRLRHLANVEQLQQIREGLTLEKRMAEAQRRAKLQHVDISHELHVIRQMTARAHKGGRGDPPAALSRLVQVEAKLDFRPDLAA